MFFFCLLFFLKKTCDEPLCLNALHTDCVIVFLSSVEWNVRIVIAVLLCLILSGAQVPAGVIMVVLFQVLFVDQPLGS